MNILRLALLLGASSSAAASGLKDNRIEYKIDPINDPQLTDVFAGFNDARSTIKFDAKYAEISAKLNGKKRAALAALDAELKGIDEIVEEDEFSEYNFKRFIASLGQRAIEAAKRDWTLRSEVLDFLRDTGLMVVSEMGGKIEMLQVARNAVQSVFHRKCANQSLTACFSANMEIFDRYVDPVKKWTMAQEMFTSLAGVNTGDWFKPDWKPLLGLLNGPENRFAVAPIGEDLNLVAGWKSNGEDLAAAIATLRRTLATSRARIPAREAALKADFKLRESVAYAILATSEEVPLVDFAVIGRRVKAFERIVEGVVRAHQSSTRLDTADVDKAVKAWLMAVQMFTPSGSDQLAAPSAIGIRAISEEGGAAAADKVDGDQVTPTQEKVVIHSDSSSPAPTNASVDSN